MLIYAGVDEAGYGPLFGPLVVGRCVLAVDFEPPRPGRLPPMWRLLGKAVCRDLGKRRGRLAVNDSKKLRTAASGIKHLEAGVLAFAALAELEWSPADVGLLLDHLGEKTHRKLHNLPWYAPDNSRPWDALPLANTDGELAIARKLLKSAADRAGVQVVDMGAAIVFEDRFNRMVAATRSKASTSFTFVARHLDAIWQRFGEKQPTVIVDRQSGRTHYLQLLATSFPQAELAIQEESDGVSAYRLIEHAANGATRRAMTVRFEVNADGTHMPASLASMISKYTRELLMARFQSWFSAAVPAVKPTAGYASDAKRFWREIQPKLAELAIDPAVLKRRS